MELTLQSDELFQVMKVHMNTEDEQIFMASHYLYLQHGTDSTKFVVDFDDVWKNVDFTQKANAKRLLEKHFTEQIDYRKNVSSEIKTNFDEKAALLLGRAGFKKLGWRWTEQRNYIANCRLLQKFLYDSINAQSKNHSFLLHQNGKYNA